MANAASSSNLALLVSDFQALASETKRKHADVREAADKALNLLRSTPDQVLAALRRNSSATAAQAEDIIRPIFMGCATKNAKVVAIALGSLQRLITIDAIPPPKIPQIVAILTAVLPLGVEIQLRILQTLPSLFSRCSLHLHDGLLADALLLCFRLQDSRIAVVSSTSAATLRQLVMVVFEGVAAEDQAVNLAETSGAEPDPSRKQTDFVVSIPAFEKLNAADEAEITQARQVVLRPSAKDAYLVFEDLCLLVNGDSPSFLKLQALPKTFGLELIESVMTGHSHLFQQHPELIYVLRSQLCPLLIRAMSEKPVFALTMRLMRVAFLLLKQFCDDLLVEAEIFLSLLIKTVSIDHNDHQSDSGPPWLRVLALEIFRGLCADFALLMRIYERYDLRSQDRTSGIFTAMMSTLNRLASEKPTLLGINHDITPGPSFTHQSGAGANVGVQGMIDGVVGMATQAAAPLVGAQQQGGLTVATATMKLQCIDQLDKAEAPPIPETYVYLLSLQCLSNVAEGFAGFALVRYEEIRRRRPTHSPDGTVWAPAALNLDTLKSWPDIEKLKMVKNMADKSWPALLASLSFFVSTNLDDELFSETLSSMQSFTYACGVLDLPTPRDAFLLTFCKFAVPPSIVGNVAVESSGSNISKPSQSVLSADSLGLGPSPAPTSLSTRSYAFLRTVLSVAQYLAGSLDATWYTVFETLQNAEFVLSSKSKKRVVSNNLSSQAVAGTNNETDEVSIQTSIQRLFDCSRTLDASAFTSFVAALCRLSSEMVGLISDEEAGHAADPKTPTSNSGMRRRASGMNASRAARPNERSFCVTKLGAVALLNISRIINEDPHLGWAPITSHLLAVQRYNEAPSSIRLQAADALDQILLSTPKHIINVNESLQRRIQSQITETLSRQIEPEARPQTSTDLEVRKLGFETLFKIMENNGHSFIAGWLSILDILRTACPSPLARLGGSSSKHQALANSSKHPTAKLSTLIRTSFPTLQLICTDFLSALNLEELRQCISVLAEFGRQTEDINIALTAGGLLWQVSDHVQGKNKLTGSDDDSFVRLWMYLLSKLLKLSHASRQEVRDGAISTLFRTIGLYGNLLSESVWDELLWDVVFPLINLLSESIKNAPSVNPDVPVDHMNAEIVRQPNGAPLALAAKQLDDSKILVLESTGKVLFDHMSSHIVKTPKFQETWKALIQHLQHSFISDRPSVGTVAMRTMTTILTADLSSVNDDGNMIGFAWEFVWDAVVEMSKAISVSPDQSSTGTYFTQVALEAYIQVLRRLQTSSRLEMNLKRVHILLKICKDVLTYSNSPDYRPDVDVLSPLQLAVFSTLDDVKLETPGAPSALIILLSELSTLVFTSSFEVSDPSSNRPTSTRVSYVAMCKATQPRLVNLYETSRSLPDIYNTQATSKVFRSFAVPLRLKYDCPASFKYGSASPLWKTATSSFLSIIRTCLPSLMQIQDDVNPAEFKDVWTQLVETFSTALLADCHFAQSFELEMQYAEENFDLALIASLELDVLPYLGSPGIPDSVIRSLAKAVQEASRLYEFALPPSPSSISTSFPETEFKKGGGHQSPFKETRFISDFGIQANEEVFGTSAESVVKSRERFAYWCFDLLFLFCKRNEQFEKESERKRVAALCLLALLDRCSAAIKTYVADAELRGRVPFPRIRDEEVVYIFQKLLSLPLWDGCLAASYSKDPSSGATELDRLAPSDVLVGSLLAGGTDAHLLYLQPHFLDLLSLDISSSTGRSKFSASHDFGLHHHHQNYKPFRDLLQATDCKGSGLEGRWPSLVLGQVGIIDESEDDDDLKHQTDLKQLALMCLRRIQAQTAIVLG